MPLYIGSIPIKISDDTKLPLAGGTMTGDITFKGITGTTYPINSNGIIFSGGTDGAAIYYTLAANNEGKLIIESRDDNNASIILRNKETSTGLTTKEIRITDGNLYTRNIYPQSNTTYNLGSSSVFYNNGYIKRIISNQATSWVDGAKANSAIYMNSTNTESLKSIASVPSTNGRFIIGSVNASLYAGYINNTNLNANTNLMTKNNILCNESGDMVAKGRMTCAALTVNGKKVFIQSRTPSGATNGDIWIVTK